ncbi:MAG: pyridoxal phosphate-dependent aminotransferase [Desulfobacterales bacterium]|nr:pyridoxal phosphate-dependent aminotransferase [Desulfobacterales bacterium]
MFSNRGTWDVSPNPLSRLLEKKKAGGETVLDLTQSNPTRAGFHYEDEKILTALAQPRAMVYEPDPRGFATAREAVKDYYRELGKEIDVSSIFLTASTSEAYAVLFKLLGNSGDEILIPRPGYPLLSFLAVFEDLQPVAYPLKYDDAKGWSMDLEVLQALITPSTRAVVVVNPNNPTGSFLKEPELKALDSICREHDLALIVDEVFSDFGAAPEPGRVRTAVNRSTVMTFVLNGLSKVAGLPQMKLGWIVVGGKSDLAETVQARLEMMLDFYLSVSAPVQHAAKKLLQGRKAIQDQMHSRLEDNSRFLKAQLAQTANCKLLRREGGWYGILEISDAVSDEDRVLQLLEGDNTLVHPGYFYGFDREGFVVVSLLTPVEIFQSGISRLIQRFGRDG